MASLAERLKGEVATTGVGYSAGAGGTVTQATSKSTGVTLNKTCGQITMHNANLAPVTAVAFTVSNNLVATTDTIVVNIDSVGTVGSYLVCVGAVGAGSFDVVIYNCSLGILGKAVVLNFAVVKAVAA